MGRARDVEINLVLAPSREAREGKEMTHHPVALALVKTPIGHYQWILETDVADDETVIDRAVTRFPPLMVRRQVGKRSGK